MSRQTNYTYVVMFSSKILMQLFLLKLSLILLSVSLNSQTLFKTTHFDYYAIGDFIEADEVLVFLHGGLKNPVIKDGKNRSFNDLIEGNQFFISQIKSRNMMVIAPIVNTKFNWVENYYSDVHSVGISLRWSIKGKAYESVDLETLEDPAINRLENR